MLQEGGVFSFCLVYEIKMGWFLFCGLLLGRVYQTYSL